MKKESTERRPPQLGCQESAKHLKKKNSLGGSGEGTRWLNKAPCLPMSVGKPLISGGILRLGI